MHPLPPLSLPHWPHQWPRLLRHPARQRLPMARWLALAGEPWQQCWRLEKHWLMLVPVPVPVPVPVLEAQAPVATVSPAPVVG